MPYTIPFGKHKGLLITEAPLSWVTWGAENLTHVELRAECAKEAARRRGGDNPGRPEAVSKPQGIPVEQVDAVFLAQRMRDIVAVGSQALIICPGVSEAATKLRDLITAMEHGRPAVPDPAAEDEVPF